MNRHIDQMFTRFFLTGTMCGCKSSLVIRREAVWIENSVRSNIVMDGEVQDEGFIDGQRNRRIIASDDDMVPIPIVQPRRPPARCPPDIPRPEVHAEDEEARIEAEPQLVAHPRLRTTVAQTTAAVSHGTAHAERGRRRETTRAKGSGTAKETARGETSDSERRDE